MKTAALLSAFFASVSASAFAPGTGQPALSARSSTSLKAEIGESGVSFSKVAREWRCKNTEGPSGGPGDSESLKACQSLLDEFLPKIKELPGAEVTRQVCGGCLDFKVSVVQPLEEHGAWADADYEPLESEFMGKLKAIEGTSLHETQEITFEAL